VKAQLQAQLDRCCLWAGEALGVAAVHIVRWGPQRPPWALQTLGKHRTLTTEDAEPEKGYSMWGRTHWDSHGQLASVAVVLASSEPDPATGPGPTC